MGLEQLIKRLDALHAPSSEALAAALNVAISREELVEFARFDERNYRRNLVIKRAGYELRLLCWLPGQRMSLHGHDGAACALRVIAGEATEFRIGRQDSIWQAGDVLTERDANVVHQIANLGSEPLMTLNAYAPSLDMDQPPASYSGRHVVIVGGGLSGAALAIHLLNQAHEGIRVSLVERGQGPGRGVAYGTNDPNLLLNVPAGRMSLFTAQPGDFVAWAKSHGPQSASFLGRRLYGSYVEDRLERAIRQCRGKLWFHRGVVVAVSKDGVRLEDGSFLNADAIVLATGNQPPVVPAAIGKELLGSEKVIRDPWDEAALGKIERDESLLVVGTGLTAADVLFTLRNRGHLGPITCVSRHGLLPRPHLAAGDPRRVPITVDPGVLPKTTRALTRHLRREATQLGRQGIAWQCLMDGLRPHTATLWARLSQRERALFLRRLRPYWEVLRHRASVEVLSAVEALRDSEQLEILAGDLTRAQPSGGRVDLTLALRTGVQLRRLVDRIVLCTGPQTDVRRSDSALFASLLSTGLAQADPLGLGLVTDDDGRVIDASGRVSSCLYVMGSLRRARMWETTAVPELVIQAERTAALVSDSAAR